MRRVAGAADGGPAPGFPASTMVVKEYLDSERVNFLVWRFVCSFLPPRSAAPPKCTRISQTLLFCRKVPVPTLVPANRTVLSRFTLALPFLVHPKPVSPAPWARNLSHLGALHGARPLPILLRRRRSPHQYRDKDMHTGTATVTNRVISADTSWKQVRCRLLRYALQFWGSPSSGHPPP
jgi:hypothetical protein